MNGRAAVASALLALAAGGCGGVSNPTPADDVTGTTEVATSVVTDRSVDRNSVASTVRP